MNARVQRWRRRDQVITERINRWGQVLGIRTFFVWISRAGDGSFWYALMAAIVIVDGHRGLAASLHMAATGLVALLMYRSIKRRTRRPRPFASDRRVRAWIAPLDEFSFPSGHTLHAVSFSVVAIAWYPRLAWLLLPFTAAVALSRVVLGLHYPSDVLAAGLLASVLGSASLLLAI